MPIFTNVIPIRLKLVESKALFYAVLIIYIILNEFENIE